MSKLVFPSVLPASVPYRGFVSEFRTWFQRIASWVEKNGPESATELARQLAPLVTASGSQIVAPGGTDTVISQGEVIAQISDSTNSANGRAPGTATVAGGVLTNVQFTSVTNKIIKNGVAYPLSAAPTGVWATSITFTINGSGVITGAVLS